MGVTVGFWDDDAAELLQVQTKWRLRTHLMFNYESPQFWNRLTVEAGVLMLLSDVEGSTEEDLWDAGTYLRLVLSPRCSTRCEVSLILFPMVNQQLRLGHQHGVSHGRGTYMSQVWAPGFLLRGDLGPGHYFVGYKARGYEVPDSAHNSEDLSEKQTPRKTELHHSWIAGTGWDLLDSALRLELAVGHLAQGVLRAQGIKEGTRGYAHGGAARVAYHRGMPLDSPLDVTFDRDDVNWALRVFQPRARVRKDWSHMVSLEGVLLGQRLADTDTHGQIAVQPLWAMALLARVGWSSWIWEVGTRVRSTSFVLKDEPGFPRFRAFPEGAETTPEAHTWTTAQYHVAAANLSVALAVELAQPATITTRWGASLPGSGAMNVKKSAVIKGVGWLILPAGEDALPETRVRLAGAPRPAGTPSPPGLGPVRPRSQRGRPERP